MLNEIRRVVGSQRHEQQAAGAEPATDVVEELGVSPPGYVDHRIERGDGIEAPGTEGDLAHVSSHEHDPGDKLACEAKLLVGDVDPRSR